MNPRRPSSAGTEAEQRAATRPDQRARGGWGGAMATGLLVLYPLAAYLGLRYATPRVAAALLMLLLAPNLYRRWKHTPRAALRPLAPVWVAIGAALLSAVLLNSAGGLLFVPALINASLALTFGATLWRSPPLIERFARLVDPDLTPAETAWCRRWTWLWTIFLCGNGSVALVLAWQRSLVAWTAYNGLISYLLIGTLVASEYLLRKARFGRFRDHWLDRQLQRWIGHRRNQP